MSRSGYDDYGDDNQLALYRQAVERAIRGRRGQALLREIEASLLELPEKVLCSGWVELRENGTGDVCALGAVELRRRQKAGQTREKILEDLFEEHPEDEEADRIEGFDAATSLLREIMYVNDEASDYREGGRYRETGAERYLRVLAWVRKNLEVKT